MSRYIDADALEQHKFISWTMPEFFNEKSFEQQAYQLGWNNAIEAIMENEPTADVVEVKHGEWIRHVNEPSLWSCSICETVIYSEHEEDRLKFHKWCGCCGADMRERREDGRNAISIQKG